MSVPAHPIESLLAHRAWVRGFARSLVRDESRADDLEQQAWLAALERPPERGDSPRGWLATVLRRAAGKERRTDFRRDRRERAAARPEPLPGTDDLAAHAEVIERIVRAALELEEPYRSVVLLRFFEGLEPGEIARRTGTPVETIRTRLRRALERLRERFDREHGGERRAWVLALLPVAGPPGGEAAPAGGGAASAASSGAIAMTGKIAAACAAVACALLLWLVLREDAPAQHPVRETAAKAPEAKKADTDLARVDAPAPPKEAEGRATAQIGHRLRLRIVRADGSPLPPEEEKRLLAAEPRFLLVEDAPLADAGIKGMMRTAYGAGTPWTRTLTVGSDKDGAFLDPPVPEGRWRLFVSVAGYPPRLGEDVALPASGESVAEVRLPAVERTIRVRAVDAETKAPLAGAAVTPYFEFGDDQAFLAGLPIRADAQGELEIPIPAGENLQRVPTWWIEAPGRAAAVIDSRPPGQREGTLEVPVPATARIEGTAYLSSGAPAAGKAILTGRKGMRRRATVDAEGRFAIDDVPAAGFYTKWQLMLVESESPLRVGGREARVQPGKTTTVQIGEPYEAGSRATFRGRVTAGGRPVEGATILIRGGDGRSKESPARMATTDAEGRYAVEGIPEGEASVFVWTGGLDDGGGVKSIGLRKFAAGEEVAGDFDLPGGRLRVKVLDAATGLPVKGAGAGAGPEDREAGKDRFPGWTHRPSHAAYAGPDGTVLLRGLLPSLPHRLQVRAPGYANATVEHALPGDGEEPPVVEVRLAPAPR